MASTVRISLNSDQMIKELVKSTKKSKVDIMEEALKLYRFHERMSLLEEEYQRLRSDEEAWSQELDERKELEGTLLDGLEDY